MSKLKTVEQVWRALGDMKKRGVTILVQADYNGQTACEIGAIDYVDELNAVVIFPGKVVRQ